MKYVFLTLFSLFAFFGNSQDNSKLIVYLDVNKQQISKQEYFNLRNLKATFVSKYKSGTLTYKTITLRNKFGQLCSHEFNQIDQLTSSRSSHSVNDKQHIVNNSIDTLHNYESYIKSHPYNFDPSTGKKKIITNSRIFILKDVDVKKYQSKDRAKKSTCVKRIEKKFKTKTAHIINSNCSDLTSNDGLNKIDDSGILKRKFMSYITGNCVVIIKSDGNHLMTKHSNSKLEKELLKNEDWPYFKDSFVPCNKEKYNFQTASYFLFTKFQ
jgi:hypothetical protein